MNTDEILVNQLRKINYKGANDFANCENVTGNQLIAAVIYIFNQIPSTKGKVGEPPKSKALQFNFANKLVELTQSLSYGGDLTYDTFLMPKDDKTRAILRFLISKVPVEQAHAPTAPVASGYSPLITAAQTAFAAAKKLKPAARRPLAQPIPPLNSSLSEVVKSKINDEASKPKIPFFSLPFINNGYSFAQQCGVNSFASLIAINDRDTDFDELMNTQKKADMDSIRRFTKRAFVAQSVTLDISLQPTGSSSSAPKAKIKSHLENVARFEFHTRDQSILNGVAVQAKNTKTSSSDTKLSQLTGNQTTDDSALTKEENDGETKPETPVVEEPKEIYLTNEQIEALKAELKAEKLKAINLLKQLESQIGDLEQLIDEETEEIEVLTAELNELLKENAKLEAELEKIKKIAQVSQADDSQIKKLQKDLLTRVTDLLEVANQWEPKRTALIQEYRALASAIKHKNSDKQLTLNRIAKLKKQIQEGQQKLQETTEQIERFESQIGLDSEDQLNRHHYVQIILEQVKKLEKKEEAVEAVRADIRSQHQRMNQTIETVKRTWILTEGTIYSKAREKNQEWMKKTYRMAVDLLMLYETISEDVETSGKLTAQTMDLEAKIERLENQIDNEALERVQRDLRVVQEEIAQIKSHMPQEEHDEIAEEESDNDGNEDAEE